MSRLSPHALTPPPTSPPLNCACGVDRREEVESQMQQRVQSLEAEVERQTVRALTA